MAEKLKNNPLVSVIIPCYNAEKYVESAVRSIMNQTYKNLEIIVTDDCSTDKTFEILQRLAKEDSRIKLYKNETNLKIVKTLNNQISQANGKYIARMDADDISLPKRIEKQVEFLENHTDYGFCGTNAYHIDENGKTIDKSVLPETFEDNKFFLKFYSTFYHPTVMIRSDVYKKNLYNQEFLYAEDYELWSRLIFEKNLKGSNLQNKFFLYRIFNNQSSEKHRKEQNDSSAKIFDKYKIMQKENVEFHKSIFFTHSKIVSDQELDYAKKQFSELLSKKFKYSFKAIQKILFHIKKNYPKSEFMKFVLTPKGFFVCVKTFFEKIKK